MSVYDLIKERRSIRSFLDKRIPRSYIERILESARWAPSGLNNQPWRFVIVSNKTLKERISRLTKYSYVIDKADCAIFVFLDKESVYNRDKDIQAIGACIENMLLTASGSGVASCWIGEILNKKKEVNRLLDVSSRYELMAAVSLGYSHKKAKSSRICLKRLVLKEFS